MFGCLLLKSTRTKSRAPASVNINQGSTKFESSSGWSVSRLAPALLRIFSLFVPFIQSDISDVCCCSTWAMIPFGNIPKILLHQKCLCVKRVISNFPAMEKTILYGDIISPPVRFVMMTASYLGFKLNFHEVELFCGEHKSEFYTKINPLQKVPALAIGNERICDSHTIAIYLCNISNNKELYPVNTLTRAKVDEMLFFNAGSLFPLDSAIFTAYFAGERPIKEEQVKQWNFLLDHLQSLLEKNKWLGGEKMMLSDLCCAATVSSLRILLPPLERHNKVNEWIARLQLLPFYNINEEGLHKLKCFVDKVRKV